jgi:hypothetical protein
VLSHWLILSISKIKINESIVFSYFCVDEATEGFISETLFLPQKLKAIFRTGEFSLSSHMSLLEGFVHWSYWSSDYVFFFSSFLEGTASLLNAIWSAFLRLYHH